MPKDETPSKVDERLKEVRDRYRMARDGWRPIYDKAKEDIEFVYDIGEGQWPSSIRTKRENAKRPVITINKLLKFARQVRGQSQQNKPRVKVIPVDNNTDPQIAELYDGLIRKIEYLSDASNAYDTAYAHSLTGGVGFWRIITQWCEDNPFNQELWIRRIIDPFSVHLDPAAKSFNYEDARYCFVEESISKDEYERQYPDSDLASFEGTLMEKDQWYSEDRVRVAEYFWKEHYTVDMGLLDDGSVVQLGKDSEKRIANDGLTIVSRRTVDKHRVRWMKTNGFEILKEGEWPGKYIPIIPVFGEEIVFGGGKEYLSLFRGAKDPQRMYNYWATAGTEAVALAPKSPFIVDHRQIDGFESEWEEANEENRMYIRYNAIAGLNKPTREPQTQIPVAIMTMMQSTAHDIEDHLGRYDASKGAPSNERSGRAILARVEQSDRGSYVFVDNLTRAVVYCGRQLIDLIPKIYDSQRAIRVMDETGQDHIYAVNTPAVGKDGKQYTINDLSVGKYDVIASVGSSYASKRTEMVEMMVESMQYAPQLAHVIAPLIFKYADFPGAQEVYGEMQKAIEAMQAQEKPVQ
ncbi:MAG: portal protein [Methanomethylophilus sp.]|jgi:hypothetical protein